ncbi:MAG: hypothetical protein KY476_08020 [Planctomycetes bacterium]|nr:hypothetical protein [Planctomycetota bacterium]
MPQAHFATLTAALLAACAVSNASAQEARHGAIRISDRPHSSTVAHAVAFSVSDAAPQQAECRPGEVAPCPECEAGYYGDAHAHAWGHHGYGPSGYDYPPARHHSPLSVWLCHDGSCTHSPDHGWARPVKHPINRVPVLYNRWWPTRWYGEPGSGLAAVYPTVYQPTDTTQLGYYYQRVPFWTQQPERLPAPPWPPQWHHRECPWLYGTNHHGYAPYRGPHGLHACLHRLHGHSHDDDSDEYRGHAYPCPNGYCEADCPNGHCECPSGTVPVAPQTAPQTETPSTETPSPDDGTTPPPAPVEVRLGHSTGTWQSTASR